MTLDSIQLVDQAHRRAMEINSNMLRDAILAAKAGTHPGTPSRPKGLPPKGNERGASGDKHYVRRQYARSQREAILQMHGERKKPGEIAALLKVSHQHVTAVIGAERKRKMCELTQRINEHLWK